MLPYAGRTHAAILDAIEHQLPERDDAMPINALREELAAIASTGQQQPHNLAGSIYRGGYFPGWHGITEIGY